MQFSFIPLIAIASAVVIARLRAMSPQRSVRPILLMTSSHPSHEPHDLWGASYNPEELRTPVAPDETEGAISPFLLIGFLAAVFAIFIGVILYYVL